MFSVRPTYHPLHLPLHLVSSATQETFVHREQPVVKLLQASDLCPVPLNDYTSKVLCGIFEILTGSNSRFNTYVCVATHQEIIFHHWFIKRVINADIDFFFFVECKLIAIAFCSGLGFESLHGDFPSGQCVML
jgi:hypothetical protein